MKSLGLARAALYPLFGYVLLLLFLCVCILYVSLSYVNIYTQNATGRRLDKSKIDRMIAFSAKIGQDYYGTWHNANSILITITNRGDASLESGNRVMKVKYDLFSQTRKY